MTEDNSVIIDDNPHIREIISSPILWKMIWLQAQPATDAGGWN